MNKPTALGTRLLPLMLLLLLWLPHAHGATPAGYTEYYIPGDEDVMFLVFDDLADPIDLDGVDMVSNITVTAWSSTISVYYDHWEDGYDFDPDDPSTADETVILADRGDIHTFFTDDILIPRPTSPVSTCSPAGTCDYDGRDHIFVAGGATTLTRASWPSSPGTVFAVAWEVYPVKPQLTAYILPFGEDLAASGVGDPNLQDFERVYALIQATRDGTVVTVDLDGDGTPDALDQDRNGSVDDATVELDAGETFLLDRVSANSTSLNTGTVIHGTNTLQVQYIIGDQGVSYEIRGLSAFPRGFWDDEYYAAVDSDTGEDGPTDIYVYNPNTATLTINWESLASSGSFTVPSGETASFKAKTGSYAPENSAVYLKGSGVFWGISTIDTEGLSYDWGYSLVPAFLLADEHFMGWAPGADMDHASFGPTYYDDSGIFISPAQDNIRVFIDLDNDGTADQTYDLNRLQTQYVTDPVDGDLSGANIWATGPHTIAFGQNPDNAAVGLPALDLGYTAIPGAAFIDKVLVIDKAVAPAVVSTTSGAQATFTLTVNSYNFSVDDIDVTDFLPPGWVYVDDSTTITLPDKSTISGNSADPDTIVNGGGRITYLDRFESAVYNNNGDNDPGTLTWASNWIEDGETTNPTANDIRIIQDEDIAGIYAIRNNNKKDLAVGRQADLSGYDSATLSFDYRRRDTDSADDIMYVEVCAASSLGTTITCSDAGGWTQVYTVAGPTNDSTYQSASVDLAATFLTSTFAVRLSSYGTNLNKKIYFDNVQIQTGAAQLIWDDTTLGDMGENQTIVIEFTAETARDFNAGDFSRNVANAVGTRTVEGITQTFETSDFVFVTYGEIEIEKTSDAADPLFPGDTFTYTIEVTNPSGATEPLTDISVFDALPEGVSYVAGSAKADWNDTGDYLKETFPSAYYGTTPTTYNSTDSESSGAAWSAAWVEDNDNANPKDGKIRVENDTAPATATYAIRHEDNGYAVARMADLSSYDKAFLTFDYRRKEAFNSADDFVDVEICASATSGTPITCAAGWTRIYRVEGQGVVDSEYVTVELPLSDLASYTANFALRLSTMDSGNNLDKKVYFDNIQIDLWEQTATPQTGLAGDPPNLLSASEGFFLSPGETLTLTVDVTVNDPLATGIAAITNTAGVTTAEFLLPIEDDVTDTVVNPSAQSAQVIGRVFLDANGNGLDDVGEAGIANVEVTLKDQYGTPLAVAGTGGNGSYAFPNVAPGDGYYVEVTGGLPAGLSQSAPSGRSDDRTDSFDLTAGESKTGVVLGYEPASGAVLGGTVWSDADADGTQDPGEPGLTGISVQLWGDADGDGTYTLVDTATTAPGGGYLFTEVTATGTEDYYIFIDGTQTALTGYTLTTGNKINAYDLSAGDVILDADFGARNATGTHTIADKVWEDANGDGTLDPGEIGIPGVTVALLDNSLKVIATTVTDADGEFSFTGVPGNDADYTVKITDTAGVLSDYYGTTAQALAGKLAVDNLDGDIDNTAAPSFGYNLSKTIGGTVYNDDDGDGVQDTGEPGFAGITVELWTDADGDGMIETGDTRVGTTVTSGDGTYRFSGLDDGDYVVSIDGFYTGYVFTITDSDAATDGEQRPAEVTGGGTDIGIQFPYRAAPATRKISSGTVWNDANANGVIDAGESGIGNVTLQLWEDDGDGVFEPDSDALLGSTLTASDGTYTLGGFPPGDYWAVLTDDFGVLSGYTPTYENDPDPPGMVLNQRIFMDVSAPSTPNPTDIDFGWKRRTPTLAVLSVFRAATDDTDRVVVEWQTTAEIGTVGFYLYRKDAAGGKFTRMNRTILPGVMAPQGGTYRYVDPDAVSGDVVTYKLLEVAAGDSTHAYGPFTVAVDGDGVDFSSGKAAKQLAKQLKNGLKAIKRGKKTWAKTADAYQKTAHHPSAAKNQRLKAAKHARKRAEDLRKKLTSGAGKIATVETGIHYLDVADIARVLGVTEAKARQFIAKTKLTLSNLDEKIAWAPADDGNGILFYATAVDSPYTDENIYWLEQGKGEKIRTVNGGVRKVLNDSGGFTETVRREENRYALTALYDDPEDDYWGWAYLFGGDPVEGSKPFTIRSDGIDPGASAATLTVSLKGVTDTTAKPDHHVSIQVNGLAIGDTHWNGTEAHVFEAEFNANYLNDGDNTITVTGLLDTGAPYSVFYVNAFELRYRRTRLAFENRLALPGGNAGAVAIDGFTAPDIMVFDTTDPARPKRLEKIRIEGVDGRWRVAFKTAGPDSRYLALTGDAYATPESVRGDRASALKNPGNRADYVIITPLSLADAARSLADYRRAQGLRTMVVDVEDIMDEFNYGLNDPGAIRDFLSHAYHNWKSPPGYVVLAGEGSFDYKDYLGNGDNLVPAMMVSTPFGLFPADTRYADVLGDDGVPEMAVGRLPVLTPEELLAMIEKIKAYEAALKDTDAPWKKRVMLLADDPDDGGNFPADSDDIGAIVPPGYTTEKIYLSDDLPLDIARPMVQSGLTNGAFLLNFFGHGSVISMAQGLLNTGDVPLLENGDRLTIVAAMTCVVGQFALPGYDALSEALLLHPTGGAIGVLAPSGLSMNDQAKMLDEEFFYAVFDGENATLGEAVQQAFRFYATRGERYILEINNLMGDPALRIR